MEVQDVPVESVPELEMTRAARALPEAVVWRGDLCFLLTSLGHSHWEARTRARVSGAQDEATKCFQRIPWVNDTQSASLVHVWRHQGKLLVARSQTRRHRRVCQKT